MREPWGTTLEEIYDARLGRARSDSHRSLVRAEWKEHLVHHVDCANLASDLVVLVLDAAAPAPGDGAAKRVATQLLVQLVADIDAISQLASGGCPYQAVALAASTFEHAMTQISIGADDDRAQRWLDHDESGSSMSSVRSTVGLAMDNLEEVLPGLKGNIGDAYRGMYLPLCTFKHGNPVVQQYIGTFDDAASTVECVFPKPDRRSVIAAMYACEVAAKCAWFALLVYTRHHAGPDGRALGGLLPGLNNSLNKLKALRGAWTARPN